MKKMIVYFHGYGSSSTTDKVEQCRNAGFETYAWDIDIDPTVSLTALCAKLDDLLSTHINRDIDLVFVGTSLGAWYACKLAAMFDVKAVLINPAYDPQRLLPQIGCPTDIADKYEIMQPRPTDIIFIAADDELINFDDAHFGSATVIHKSSGGHRFNGAAFDEVLDYIKIL